MTSESPQQRRYTLTVACRSAPGQVAAVAAFLAGHGAYVEQFAVYDDTLTARFFLRAVFHRRNAHASDLGRLREEFAVLAPTLDALEWQLHDLAQPLRVLLMVSKLDHCLLELLAAWKRGELPMQPVAIVSNHEDLRAMVEAHGLPYTCLPVTPQTKATQESRLLDIVQSSQADLVVLARYMQVLSDDLCRRLAGRVINIHHGFLPAFKGAKPYHQAFERGVKLIGATAHFATPDLDEGPIIDQATERVDHAHAPEDLLNVGRQLECTVLSRALKSVLEHRVFINGQRTVVLR
ncbi:formyltetrahydrofolate deformylase [Azohydromonas caseinilytica]|uniref:Formyltetrahydrofolate deformylase n=1 Tax=Azohydromonas caseinilytica TaxID=2728836 RepID=A0A848FE23_9BURK|nr:formyltetrahydrofolate deformylase [Azohydromonas caseinilytica]NML17286.1 formyltetrahydrofolate deformylase [Azohydromonas caseinilytica]